MYKVKDKEQNVLPYSFESKKEAKAFIQNMEAMTQELEKTAWCITMWSIKQSKNINNND